jgi:hypothetical protein
VLDVQFRALKKDPYQPQCDEVVKWVVKDSISQAGNETIKIECVTPYRSFTVWTPKNPKHSQAFFQLKLINSLKGSAPKSVKYVKEKSGFFRFLAFNEPIDVNEADQALLALTAK